MKVHNALVEETLPAALSVAVEQVHRFETANRYVRLLVGGGTRLIRHTVRGLKGRLDPWRFAQIHRSGIVNLEYVASLELTPGGNYTVRLADSPSPDDGPLSAEPREIRALEALLPARALRLCTLQEGPVPRHADQAGDRDPASARLGTMLRTDL